MTSGSVGLEDVEGGDPSRLGVIEAGAAIRAGRLTATALVEASLERIAADDPSLRAWVVVDGTAALEAARALDRDAVGGHWRGPLHGIPIGVKDLIDVAGLPTTAGAPAFAHRFAEVDATLVARLRRAGAVIVGKTVPTPFAYRDPAGTRNPWSFERTPGGSSSGSAAAVAAGHVPATVGTQTIGSILRPAAFCGVVGLKGDHGAVPLDGVLPLAPSLDHAGPLARSVTDAALVEAVMAGRRPDGIPGSTARPAARLGVDRTLFDRAEPVLQAHLEDVLRRSRAAGGEIVDVELPAGFESFVAAGMTILAAEASEVHAAWYAVHADAYPPAIGALVATGLASDPDAVAAAQAERAAYRRRLVPVLDAVDAIVSPVAPSVAPDRAGGTGDPSLCAPWSVAGVPAISLPTGVDANGMPFAVQLVSGPGRSTDLLHAAGWLESLVGFAARPPAR